jgi:thioredoxin
MKTIGRIAAFSLAAIIIAAACGSTGAENKDKKEKKTEKTDKKGYVKELDAAAFNATVYDLSKEDLTYLGSKPAIVDFTASWCGPCQRIAPILEELAAEYDGQIVIYKVDIDKNPDLAKTFNVSSIPSILYIPAGDEEPSMTVGSRDKTRFRNEINTILLKK